VTIWRILRSAYAASGAQAFDGNGSAKKGARWNSRGVRVAYGSTSVALAVLEYLVNFSDRTLVPTDLVVAGATIPDDAVEDGAHRVPSDWKTIPAPPSCAAFGDRWAREFRSLALIVPSVVISSRSMLRERNVLLNPLHPRISEVSYDRPEPIRLDERLL
jgi:RES domain-containing protein